MNPNQPKKPEVAIGVKRVPGGWTVVEYQIKDGKVVAEKQTEPDLRSLTLEKFQQAVFRFWEADG